MRKKIILVIYISLAVSLSAIESVILPSAVIPGVKLGFANLVVLTALYQFGIKEALYVSAARVLIVSLVLGTFLTPTFIISLTGMAVSFLALVIVFKSSTFSVIGVSVVASVFHIIGQVVAVVMLMNLSSIISVAPFLIYVAVISGFITGYIAKRILKVLALKTEVAYEF